MLVESHHRSQHTTCAGMTQLNVSYQVSRDQRHSNKIQPISKQACKCTRLILQKNSASDCFLGWHAQGRSGKKKIGKATSKVITSPAEQILLGQSEGYGSALSLQVLQVSPLWVVESRICIHWKGKCWNFKCGLILSLFHWSIWNQYHTVLITNLIVSLEGNQLMKFSNFVFDCFDYYRS